LKTPELNPLYNMLWR